MRQAAPRWSAAITVAIALSSIALTPTPVAAQSRILSIFGGRATQPSPTDRDSPKVDLPWPFKSSSKAPPRATATAAAAATDKTTEDRRRVPSGAGAGAVTTAQRPSAPYPTTSPVRDATVRETTTTYQKFETTSRKLEMTTKDRFIITAPLQSCPDGQRMNADRKCVENFTDPEEAK